MDAKELIDLIMPLHQRASCSDENICNGFYTLTGESWHGRCTRCMYLEVINGSPIPEGFEQYECVG